MSIESRNLDWQTYFCFSLFLFNSSSSFKLYAFLLSNTEPCARDISGRVFLDRNPERFGLVLEYLRTGTLPLAFPTEAEEKAFYAELAWFRITFATFIEVLF